jgi:hypothetical protein
LLFGAWDHDGVHTFEPAQEVERLREEWIRMPVVERDVRRGPKDDEHAVAVDTQSLEHRRVRLEVGEVVLLLQPGIAQ